MQDPVETAFPLLESTRDSRPHRRCIGHIGGDPLTGSLPPRVPAPLQTYLRGALRTGAVQMDAWQLYRDFADLLAHLWGERRFIPFTMPARR